MTSISPRITNLLSANPGVAVAYVFGSVAGGTARPDSDVDIAILFTATPPHTLDSARFALAGELEAALGAPVDLVVLNDAPVDLSIRVLWQGRLAMPRRGSRLRFGPATRRLTWSRCWRAIGQPECHGHDRCGPGREEAGLDRVLPVGPPAPRAR